MNEHVRCYLFRYRGSPACKLSILHSKGSKRGRLMLTETGRMLFVLYAAGCHGQQLSQLPECNAVSGSEAPVLPPAVSEDKQQYREAEPWTVGINVDMYSSICGSFSFHTTSTAKVRHLIWKYCVFINTLLHLSDSFNISQLTNGFGLGLYKTYERFSNICFNWIFNLQSAMPLQG